MNKFEKKPFCVNIWRLPYEIPYYTSKNCDNCRSSCSDLDTSKQKLFELQDTNTTLVYTIEHLKLANQNTLIELEEKKISF